MKKRRERTQQTVWHLLFSILSGFGNEFPQSLMSLCLDKMLRAENSLFFVFLTSTATFLIDYNHVAFFNCCSFYVAANEFCPLGINNIYQQISKGIYIIME